MLFLSLLEGLNVRTAQEIRQSHLGEFRTLLDLLPSRYGQTPSLGAKSALDLRREGERLSASSSRVGLAPGTIRRHLGHLSVYPTFLVGQGKLAASPNTKPLLPKKVRGHSSRVRTDRPSFEAIRCLFHLPPFTGARSQLKPYWAEKEIFHSGGYFVPMLLA